MTDATLSAKVTADIADFRKKFDDLRGALDRIGRAAADLERRMGGLQAAASQLGPTIGGPVNRALDLLGSLSESRATAIGALGGAMLGAVGAAAAFAVSMGRQVEALDLLSQRTGISLQTLQGWSVTMAENDVQAESLATAMRTLSAQMIEAQNPASAAAAVFDQLGISIEQAGSTESLIRAVADRFAAMPDGAEKARLAIQLFGRAGLELIPVLNKGSAALDESRRQAERFGLVLSTEQVRGLEAADDAADRLKKSLEGLKLQLAATFAPTVASGIDLMSSGLAHLTGLVSNFGTELDKIKADHPLLSALFPGAAGLIAGIKAATQPPPVPTPPPQPQESHVIERTLALGQQQEELGRRLRDQLIERFRLLQATQHAEEALGRVTVAIIRRETAETNNLFALQTEQAELSRVAQERFERVSSSANKALDEQLSGVKALMELMPELNFQEASLLALHNQAAATDTITQSIDAWKRRHEALEADLEVARMIDEAQQALFRTESGLLGASDAARRTRLTLIELEAERERRRIEETIFNEERKFALLSALDERTAARRQALAAEFPSFMQQQLQALVTSNAFSVSQIVSSWTSGIATIIVRGGTFKQLFEQTQIALLQGALNTAVQYAAGWAMAELARTQATTAANATIAASNAATAATTASVWATAAGAMAAVFGALAIAVKTLLIGLARAAVGVVSLVVSGVSVVLNSISTVVGFMLMTIGEVLIELGTSLQSIPIIGNIIGSILIAAGGASIALGAALPGIVAGLTAALSAGVASLAAAIPALQHGGLVTRPTLAMIGEAGPEAVVPLSHGGLFGGGVTVVLEVDRQELARMVAPALVHEVRMRVGAVA